MLGFKGNKWKLYKLNLINVFDLSLVLDIIVIQYLQNLILGEL